MDSWLVVLSSVLSSIPDQRLVIGKWAIESVIQIARKCVVSFQGLWTDTLRAFVFELKGSTMWAQCRYQLSSSTSHCVLLPLCLTQALRSGQRDGVKRDKAG